MTIVSARPRLARGRALAVLLALVGSLLGAVWAASPASAHAVLVSSSPADGSRVAASPAEVKLVFDEHIELVPGTAKVISAAGLRADTGEARLDAAGTGILIPLKPELPKGSYTATWRVVSADTHIVSGSISFGVRQSPAAAHASGAAPTSPLDVVAETAGGFGYLGVILAFGTVFVALLLWPERLGARQLRTMAWVGWAVLLAGAAVDFLLQGPRATESGWGGVARLDDVGQTVQSLYGIALLARLALLLALLPLARPVLLGRRSPGAAVAPGALAVGVLVTIALGGHAAVGSDAAIAIPAAVLHLASMATWCGGLAVLLLVVLPGLDDAGAAVAGLRRWSLLAFVSVVVLIVSGEYQAWRQIQPLPSLWSTGYGVTLLIKLALVCAALLAALVAQRALLGRQAGHEQHEDGAARVLRAVRRSVRIESALVIAVVAVTTVLVSEPPASGTYGPPAQLTAKLGPTSRLEVKVDTTRRGPEVLTITPEDAAGKTLHVQSLAANLSSSQNGIAALDLKLTQRSDGSWRTTGATVPLPGTWTLTFDVSVDQASGYATKVDYTVW